MNTELVVEGLRYEGDRLDLSDFDTAVGLPSTKGALDPGGFLW
jgi:hypothetical protein